MQLVTFFRMEMGKLRLKGCTTLPKVTQLINTMLRIQLNPGAHPIMLEQRRL